LKGHKQKRVKKTLKEVLDEGEGTEEEVERAYEFLYVAVSNTKKKFKISMMQLMWLLEIMKLNIATTAASKIDESDASELVDYIR